MNTINIKGEAHPKQKGKVKIYFVFHRTGMCRAKKLIDLTGASKDWNDAKQQFKVNSSENQEKNNYLSELKLKYLNVADRWEVEGREWSPTQWANCFDTPVAKAENKIQTLSLVQVIDNLIEFYSHKTRMKNGQEVSSLSNKREYEFLKSSLSDFTRKEYQKQLQSIHFRNITYEFVSKYILYLQKRGEKNGNGGAVPHRVKKLRAVCRYADSELKIEGVDLSVFKKSDIELKMKLPDTEPKTIPYEVIKKIENLCPVGFSNLELLHIDLFLFCYYAGGMANIDAAYLTKSALKKDSTLLYERIKVNKSANVPLISKAWAIINKYKSKTHADYVLPIFTHKHITDKQKRDRLERLNRLLNRTLKKVAERVGYREKITWYAARGTYITKMIDEGFHPVMVAKHAGNSPDIIYKHYYKLTNNKETLKTMNSVV